MDIFKNEPQQQDTEVKDLLQKTQRGSRRAFLMNKAKKQFHRFPLITAGAGILLVFIFLFGIYSFLKSFQINIPQQLMMGAANIFGQELQKDEFGHTNILLLGTGGGDHDGADLTDTIMVASIDHNKKTLSLLSIPRDLYVTAPQIGGTRINAVYDYALRHQNNALASSGGRVDTAFAAVGDVQSAVGMLQETVEKITGTNVQYFVKVDFQSFIDIVDLLGGIEVDVPETFIDRRYPDNNYGYETFFLREGLQTLDGTTALKYARSRHSTSDFDRSKRQQIILSALKTSAMEQNVLTNPSKLKRIYYTISENVATNMTLREMLKASAFASELQSDNITSVVLHDDPSKKGGFLYAPSRDLFNGASVLLPNGATAYNPSYYKEIQLFTQVYFYSPELFTNPPKIQILNGTLVAGKRVGGVATRMSSLLQRYGLDIEDIGNAPSGVYLKKTGIYYYHKDAAEGIIPSLELFISGDSHFFDGSDTDEVNSVNKSDYALEGALVEGQELYDVTIVIGNDYSQYLTAY